MSQWQNVNGILTKEEPKDPVLEKTENNQVKKEPTTWEGYGLSAQEQSFAPTNTQRQSCNSAPVHSHLYNLTAMNNSTACHIQGLNVIAPDMKLPAVGYQNGSPWAQEQRPAPMNPPSQSYNSAAVHHPFYMQPAMNNSVAYHRNVMAPDMKFPAVGYHNGPSAREQSRPAKNTLSQCYKCGMVHNHFYPPPTAMNNSTANQMQSWNVLAPGAQQPPVESQDNTPKRRGRITFSRSQKGVLEDVFQNNTRYPDEDLRSRLSSQLQLPEATIQIWFKNRRAKYQQQKIKPKEEKMSPTSTTMPQSTRETPSKPDNPVEDLVTSSTCMQSTATASYPLIDTNVPSSFTQNLDSHPKEATLPLDLAQPKPELPSTDV